MIYWNMILCVALLCLFLVIIYIKFSNEKKCLQKELQQKSSVENQIIEIIPKPTFLVDITGKVLNINSRFEQHFNIKKSEILNKTFLSAPSKQVKKLGEVIERELKLARKIGIAALKKEETEFSYRTEGFITKKYKIFLSFFPSENNIIGGLIGILEDITEQEKEIDNLKKEALIDELTGCFNKRQFNNKLAEEIERAKRYNQPLSLILFDIDHFKKINDTYGHDIGDYVLKTLAKIVKKQIRKTDSLFRIGGEEFAVLLPATPLEAAIKVAEKIRKQVKMSDFVKVKKVTISLGVSSVKNDDTHETLFKRADNALYKSKNMGRNRVSSEKD